MKSPSGSRTSSATTSRSVPATRLFGRDVDLFDRGYVDSVGLAETLRFIQDEFELEVPDDERPSDEFTTTDGTVRVVRRLAMD
jgi:hypothetical protein